MIPVALGAEMIYQLTGSNLSSPQSAELNAKARASGIQKWINLTNAEAVAWIVFLCYLDNSYWPAVGGGLALAGMALKYKYAIKSGLESDEIATENYDDPNDIPQGADNGAYQYSQA